MSVDNFHPYIFFFFSRRRRHTRFDCDWSSDVCSSDLTAKVKKELKKLKMMHPTSAEATVVRNYIDWILELPWYDKSEERHDLAEAEKILEEDHYGLKKIKERILEYLAVQALTK